MVKKIISSVKKDLCALGVRRSKKIDRLIADKVGTPIGIPGSERAVKLFSDRMLGKILDEAFILEFILKGLPGGINEIIEIGGGTYSLFASFLEREGHRFPNININVTEPHGQYYKQLSITYPKFRIHQLGIGDIKEAQDRGLLPKNAHILAMNFIDLFTPEALPQIALILSEIVERGRKVMLMSDRISPCLYQYAQKEHGSADVIIIPDPVRGNLIKAPKKFLSGKLSNVDLLKLHSLSASQSELDSIYTNAMTLLGHGELSKLTESNPERVELEAIFHDLLSKSFEPYFNVNIRPLMVNVEANRLPKNTSTRNMGIISPIGSAFFCSKEVKSEKVKIIQTRIVIELTRNEHRPNITHEKKVPDIERSALLESPVLVVLIKEWACINGITLHRDNPIKDQEGNEIQVEIVGLTSEVGKTLNGRKAILESAYIDPTGRLRFAVCVEGDKRANILGTALKRIGL